MYISKVEIKNYRSYKNFSINLRPFVTVIGENNIGKSNLLEAMYLVLSHDISVYKKRKLEIEDFNYEAVHEFKKSVVSDEKEDIVFPEVRVDLYFSDPDEEQETVVNDCWFDFSRKIARITYLYSFKSPRREKILDKFKEIVEEKRTEGLEDEQIAKFIDFPIEEYDYSIVCGVDDKNIDNYWLKLIKMEYLDALRDAKSELNSNNSNKLLYRILNDREPDEFANIKARIIELDEEIRSDKAVLDGLKCDIGKYLSKLSLETETSSNNIDFVFGSIELNEVLKKIGIQYGDNAVNIDRNGLGRNNLLYIAVIMAHLYEKQNNYFRLIAIEEPEAHLCPTLQRHLANNLYDESNSNKKQIIVTTHSTHVASFLKLDDTVVLYKSGKNILSHYLLDGLDSNGADKNTISYLKKWLNATNSTMFYSRKIILVEGIAEQILIPIFYRWNYGKTLDKTNCQVINVNGVAFEHFLKVVNNGYFIKTAVLTDSDNNKHTNERATDLKEKYDSEVSKVFITSNTTFEKDILDCNASSKVKRQLVFKILQKIRPHKCNENFCKQQEENFSIDDIFQCIEKYKSDFAFELSDVLIQEMEKKNYSSKFSIPDYILEAFKFIEGEG